MTETTLVITLVLFVVQLKKEACYLLPYLEARWPPCWHPVANSKNVQMAESSSTCEMRSLGSYPPLRDRKSPPGWQPSISRRPGIRIFYRNLHLWRLQPWYPGGFIRRNQSRRKNWSTPFMDKNMLSWFLDKKIYWLMVSPQLKILVKIGIFPK